MQDYGPEIGGGRRFVPGWAYIPNFMVHTGMQKKLSYSDSILSVVNGAEWLGGNSQQVTGDSGLI